MVFATNTSALFLDYSLRINALRNFLAQGYLPTAKAVAGGSYGAEIASNRVGPEGGQVLVESTLDAIAELWPEP